MTGGVGAPDVAASAELLNQVLANAQQKSMAMAEKQMKVTVEARLGAEAGKGSNLDVSA